VRKSRHKKKEKKTPTHNEDHPTRRISQIWLHVRKENRKKKEKGILKYFQGVARILDNNNFLKKNPHKMRIIQKRN
jgi:hypothetical protein